MHASGNAFDAGLPALRSSSAEVLALNVRAASLLSPSGSGAPRVRHLTCRPKVAAAQAGEGGWWNL
jgi:hypothetical protein